jgi:hypothetical protein
MNSAESAMPTSCIASSDDSSTRYRGQREKGTHFRPTLRRAAADVDETAMGTTHGKEPGGTQARVLAGLILIPLGGLLYEAGLEVAAIVILAAGWLLALGSIVALAILILAGRTVSSEFHLVPLPTFIFFTASAGIAAEAPAAGAALGYVGLLWFYLRWRMS